MYQLTTATQIYNHRSLFYECVYQSHQLTTGGKRSRPLLISPIDGLLAGVRDDHLDSQGIVHVDEKGVCIRSVEPSDVHLSNGV